MGPRAVSILHRYVTSSWRAEVSSWPSTGGDIPDTHYYNFSNDSVVHVQVPDHSLHLDSSWRSIPYREQPSLTSSKLKEVLDCNCDAGRTVVVTAPYTYASAYVSGD